MLLAASALKDHAVEAQDGAIGTVKDLLFDDRTWQIRWLVVDTGGWLTERKVLLHPSAIGTIDYGMQTLRVALSKQQVQGSPTLSSDLPVSRQHETDLYSYYGWSPLWGGDLYGSEIAGAGLGPSRYFGNKELYDDLRLSNHGDIEVNRSGKPGAVQTASETTQKAPSFRVLDEDTGVGCQDEQIVDQIGNARAGRWLSCCAT